jgi:hypothetical protein
VKLLSKKKSMFIKNSCKFFVSCLIAESCIEMGRFDFCAKFKTRVTSMRRENRLPQLVKYQGIAASA